MPWEDRQVAGLRKLWTEGLSTAEIGRRLNISKNAVVSKAHRLNLPARPSPIKRPNADCVPVERVEKPAPMPKIVNAPLPPGRLVASSPCQWPIGDPRKASFHFCNGARADGKPYRAEHAAMAYVRRGETQEA